MIMDLLQKLSINAGEDYIKGQRESAPDLNNPEEMNQLLKDLVMGVSGGGIGGTIKTGTKAAFDLSKGTLLKRFFEKFRGKPYSVKPVKTLKGPTSGDLGDLFKKTEDTGGVDYLTKSAVNLRDFEGKMASNTVIQPGYLVERLYKALLKGNLRPKDIGGWMRGNEGNIWKDFK